MRMFNQLSIAYSMWQYGVTIDSDPGDKFITYSNTVYRTRLAKNVNSQYATEQMYPLIRMREDWTSSDSLDVQESSPYKLHISLTTDSYERDDIYESILAICCQYLSDETIQQMKMYDRTKIRSSTRCKHGDQVTLYIPSKFLTDKSGLPRLHSLCLDIDTMLTSKKAQPGSISDVALAVGGSRFINFRQEMLFADFQSCRKNGEHGDYYIPAIKPNPNDYEKAKRLQVIQEINSDPSPYLELSIGHFPSATAAHLSADNNPNVPSLPVSKPVASNSVLLMGGGFIIGFALISFIYSISDYAEEGVISEWLGGLFNNDWFTDHDKLTQSATASGILLGATTTAMGGLIGAGMHKLRR